MIFAGIRSDIEKDNMKFFSMKKLTSNGQNVDYHFYENCEQRKTDIKIIEELLVNILSFNKI